MINIQKGYFMRFTDFQPSTVKLNELKMAPSNLKKMASAIKGRCGIEFELYVPDIDTGEDNEPENDYSHNPYCYSIRDIEEFFSENEQDVSDAVEQLTDQYNEYAYNRMREEFDSNAQEVVREYIEEYDWDEDEQFSEAYIELDYSDEVSEACERWRNNTATDVDLNRHGGAFNRARKRVEEMLDEKVEESIEDQDRNYESAREGWDEGAEWPDEQEFLRHEGFHRMADLEDEYGLYWPRQGGGEGSNDMEGLASDFSDTIGRPAFGCASGYHGCDDEKGKDQYVLETDSSLSNARSGFSGVEIVAPTLPLSEMVDEIKEVIAWAKNYGCYTDESCGLHCNISIEDIPMDQLDYVKMALFVGDLHVLKEFKRQSSRYAKSAFKQLQSTVNNQPNLAYEVLTALQQNLANVAGKLIHSGTTEKMVSLNAQRDRLEVRSPGGDWMNEDISKLETMVYRFIVALDIACDPQKNKEEYATKMYKLIKPDNTTDKFKDKWASVLCQYNAGVINIDSLKQELASASMRKKPNLPGSTKPYDNFWNVTAANGQSIRVSADSPIAAVNAARTKLKLNAVQFPNNTFSVEAEPNADLFHQFGGNVPAAAEPVPQEKPEAANQPSVHERIAQAKAERAQNDLFPEEQQRHWYDR